MEPYLLLQGPSEKKTYRFFRGQELTWKLKGENEFFTARIRDLYPESQSVRIGDMILSMEKIISIRHLKRGVGVRRYVKNQGITNLLIVCGFTLFSRRARQNQAGFLGISAAVSAIMVAIGSDTKSTRELGGQSSFVLKVAGGDIREGDGD